jgi:hypothetical protein
MFRHPMEIEVFVEARQQEAQSFYSKRDQNSSSQKEQGILGQVRHLVGVALIVTGDHIAGDDSLQNRAQANDQAILA